MLYILALLTAADRSTIIYSSVLLSCCVVSYAKLSRGKAGDGITKYREEQS